MIPDSSFFCYRSGTSILHRTPASVKLFGMISCTIAVFSGSIPLLAAASLILAILTIIARTRFAVMIQNTRTVLFYGLFIALFRLAGKPLEQSIFAAELRASALYTWQLAAVLFAGTIFYETTGTTDIAHTLSSIQKKICWKKPLPDIAFHLSLTLGFIPRIFSTWESLEKAWAARGGGQKRGIIGFWRHTTILVPLLVINLLAVASDTDRAIRNRSC